MRIVRHLQPRGQSAQDFSVHDLERAARGVVARQLRTREPGGVQGHVYTMRMARINVYLPDDLADAAHAADLNISSLTQAAIRRELERTELQEWIQVVSRRPQTGVSHDAVHEAVNAAREEFGGTGG